MAKVQYGLSSLYISKRTESGGTISYSTPVAIPGAVSLNLDATESEAVFYADNKQYFRINALTAREGELEVALVPSAVMKDFMGYLEDDNGNLVETNQPGAQFALLAQFEQDDHAGKICFLNGTFGRPSTERSTIEDSISVQTQTIPINFTGETVTVDGANTQIFSYTAEYGDTNYSTFFSSVALPTFTN